VNDEMERMRKEVIVPLFEILSRNLAREAEENHRNPQVKIDYAPTYINTNISATLCHLSRFAQR
jgi:hypothetical protein